MPQDLTPEPEVEPVEATPQVEEAQDEATPTEGATPTPKMVSQEEHERIIDTLKGGHKGTVQKMRGEIAQLTAKISELDSQRTEMEYSNWLRAVEEKGGDVDYAKQVVERDRLSRQANIDLARKKQELDDLAAELNEAAIGKKAYDLLKEHGLGDEHLETLVNEASGKTAAEGRLAMENIALRLSVKAQKAKAIPSVEIDKGGGKPAAPDLSGMSESEQTGWAIEEALRAQH